jgi:hypothetical protein
VKQDPSTNNKNSKMIKSLEELSQILAAVGISISASQEEQILTAVKNLSASPEVIEKQDFHELHPQEDLEASFDHPFQPIEETKESFLRLLYGVTSTLRRIPDLCTLCNRFFTQDLSSCDDCALLAAVTLHSLQRKSYAISSELYESKQTLSTHSLRTVCTPCTDSRRKAIEIYANISKLHTLVARFIHS